MNTGDDLTMNELIQEIRSMKSMNTTSDAKINQKLDNIQSTLEPMKENLSNHSNMIKHLDFDNRRKNIIVFGLEEKDGETFQDLENTLVMFIINTLEVPDFTLSELDFCKRLKSQPNGKPRPILMGFTTQRRRISILKNRGKLKGTKIHIHEDASKEIRDKEKGLQQEVKKLRSEGKYAVLRAGKIISHDNKNKPGNQNQKKPANTTTKRAHSGSPDDTHSKRLASDLNVNITGNSMLYRTDPAEFEDLDDTMLGNTSTPALQFNAPHTSTPFKTKNP